MPTNKLRIRFVTSHDLISWTIRGAEMGFMFSHAEVVMPDGTLLGAHVDGGVEARPWGYDAKYDPIEMFADIYATATEAEVFHAFLTRQLGKPYDMEAIKAFAFGFTRSLDDMSLSAEPEWAEDTAWFCSELVAAALLAARIFPRGLPVSAQHVTPRDLCFAVAAIGALSTPAKATRAPAPEHEQARPV